MEGSLFSFCREFCFSLRVIFIISKGMTTVPLPENAINQPIMLSIAGSDCSAGAGIQADLKTASALGVYGLTAVTCVVSEIPGKVSQIQAIDRGVIEDQIMILLKSFPIAAIKTGMLYAPEIVESVAHCLKGSGMPLVIDPVMIASSGDALIQQETLNVFKEKLLPLATIVTPNMDETAVFLGRTLSSVQDLREAARTLAQTYQTAFLVKGGHLPGAQDRVDILALPDSEELYEYVGRYIPGVSTHGTGCTYSSAIASGLALGLELPQAVFQAHEYVASAIEHYHRWENRAGGNIDALNHFAY